MTDIEINGVYTKTLLVKKYRCFVTSINLHTSASLVILLLNDDGIEVDRLYKELVGDEYTAWGLDDTYIDEIAADEVKKYVTVENIVIPEPEPIIVTEPEPESI